MIIYFYLKIIVLLQLENEKLKGWELPFQFQIRQYHFLNKLLLSYIFPCAQAPISLDPGSASPYKL